MPDKNNLKSPIDDSLRGLGKLGWTESGKLHSTIKKLTSSFSDEVKHIPTKKEKIDCPACGNRCKSINGKAPRHTTPFSKEICDGKIRGYVEATVVGSVNSVIINEYEIKKGDNVAFTTYPHYYKFVDPHTLSSYIVENLYLMSNDRITLKFKGITEIIPANYFAKNFIKL